MSRLSHLSLLCALAVGCERPRDLPSASVSLELTLSPPDLTLETHPLEVRWAQEAPQGREGERGGGQGDALVWRAYPPEAALTLASPPSTEEARYVGSGLWRAPSALALPLPSPALEGAQGGTLTLIPLSGLDYRATSLGVLSDERKASALITPWFALPWLGRSLTNLSTLQEGEREGDVLSQGSMELIPPHAWSTLARRRGATSAWSLALELSELLKQRGEGLEHAAEQLSLASAASLSEGEGLTPLERLRTRLTPCVLDGLAVARVSAGGEGEEGEEGGAENTEVRDEALVYISHLLSSLREGATPSELELDAELSAPCALHGAHLWLSDTQPTSPLLPREGARVVSEGGRLDGHPVQLSLLLLPSVLRPTQEDMSALTLSGARLEALLELAQGSLSLTPVEESAWWAGSLSWEVLGTDAPLLLTLVSPVATPEANEPSPGLQRTPQHTLAGQLTRPHFEDLPSWRLSAFDPQRLNGPAHVTREALEEERRHEALSAGEGEAEGVYELMLTGRSTLGLLSVEPSLGTLRWSPFPAPGRWRAAREGERSAALLSERSAPSAQRLIAWERLAVEGGEPPLTITPISSFSALSASLAPDAFWRGEPLSFAESVTLHQALSLERSLEKLLMPMSSYRVGGAPHLDPREPPTLTRSSLTALLEDLADESSALYAPQEPLSPRLSAHLSGWRCVEGAYALGEAPPLTAPEPSAAWLRWLGEGCLASEAAWLLAREGRPVDEESLSDPRALARQLAAPLLWNDEGEEALSLGQTLSRGLLGGEGEGGALSVSVERGATGVIEHASWRDEAEGGLELTRPEGPFDDEPVTFVVSAPLGLTSLRFELMEAPWLSDEALEVPDQLGLTPQLLTRGLTERLSDKGVRAEARCLWSSEERSPLGEALMGSWSVIQTPTPDPLNPLAEVNTTRAWRLSFDAERDSTLMRSPPPCSVGLTLNASTLPSGPYTLQLSAQRVGAPPLRYTLWFEVDHEPPLPQLEAPRELELIASAARGSHHHHHLLHTQTLTTLNALKELLISFDEPVRCEQSEARSPLERLPLKPARFDEGLEAWRALELSPVEESPVEESPVEESAAQWRVGLEIKAEGSTRLALTCVNLRGRATTLTLDLTHDESPPRAIAVWLTQHAEAHLDDVRLSAAPREAHLLWSAPQAALPTPLEPWRLFDHRSRLDEPSDDTLDDTLKRWWGWWRGAQCKALNPTEGEGERCLLSGEGGAEEVEEGACEGALLEACFEREAPLTLWVLSADPQWSQGALEVTLEGALSQGGERLGERVEAPLITLNPHEQFSAEALHSSALGVDNTSLSLSRVALKELWREGAWPEPSLSEFTTLTLSGELNSPAWRTDLNTLSISLLSLLPPLAQALADVQLSSPYEPSPPDELAWLTSELIARVTLYNPHPHTQQLTLSSPRPVTLSATVRASHDAVSLSADVAFQSAQGCLWDEALNRPHAELLLLAERLDPDLLSAQSSCTPHLIPTREHTSWSASLSWRLLGEDEARLEPLLIEPGERLTVELTADWSRPPRVHLLLSRIFPLPPTLSDRYAAPAHVRGFYWREISEVHELLFGRPYQQLTELNLTASSSNEWRLERALIAEQDGEVESELVTPLTPSNPTLFTLPSSLRYAAPPLAPLEHTP